MPHLVVLLFLWLAFFVVGIVAFFAILITGCYPRALFDFNVGVLRWSWRVHYYGYGALATDRYPPFTLQEVADYPAHLDVAHPERLSRGLVLVKWWLLAIPHYVVVAVFVGGGLWFGTQRSDVSDSWAAGGLVGLLVLIAGIVVLFTGRCPAAPPRWPPRRRRDRRSHPSSRNGARSRRVELTRTAIRPTGSGNGRRHPGSNHPDGLPWLPPRTPRKRRTTPQAPPPTGCRCGACRR